MLSATRTTGVPPLIVEAEGLMVGDTEGVDEGATSNRNTEKFDPSAAHSLLGCVATPSRTKVAVDEHPPIQLESLNEFTRSDVEGLVP